MVRALKVALDENLKHKPLTDPEVATAIKEYDELKRALEGDKKPGGFGGVHYSVINGQGWTQEQTAQDLGISQPAVVKAIKIATAQRADGWTQEPQVQAKADKLALIWR